MTPTRIHRMGRLTRAEYDALPLRSSTSDYVQGVTYRDEAHDGTTFLYLGRETDPATAFLRGRPGLGALDAWRAREAVIVTEAELRRQGDLIDPNEDASETVDNPMR